MCVCIHKCVCACHRYTSHTIKVPESLTSVPGNSALANSNYSSSGTIYMWRLAAILVFSICLFVCLFCLWVLCCRLLILDFISGKVCPCACVCVCVSPSISDPSNFPFSSRPPYSARLPRIFRADFWEFLRCFSRRREHFSAEFGPGLLLEEKPKICISGVAWFTVHWIQICLVNNLVVLDKFTLAR